MHQAYWTIVSNEAELSSHLTISRSTQTAASAASATASASDAPAADNPLGFLAALVDHLLGTDSAGDAKSAPVASAQPATANASLLALDAAAPAETDAPPSQGLTLLARLTDELDALESEIQSGEKPDPDLLKKLGDTADALAALLAPQPASPAPTIDPATALDPLKAIAATTTSSLSALLDKSGNAAPAAASPASPPLPALAALGEKLAALGKAVAADAPELTQKLAALQAKLDAAQSSPQLLAGLGDPDGTTLDGLVKALAEARPAATPPTPAIAATTELPVPKTLAPSPDAADNSAIKPATSLSVDLSSATRPDKVARQTADNAVKSAPREAAALATAIAADKPDAAAQTATPVQQAATPAQPQAQPRILPAAYQPLANPINMGQMAFEMARQAQQGTSRFTIRLDPPELGRVDVRMHVDQSGAVNARLTVERAETLDMFQRDQRSLERALTQAGLDGSRANLEFSLKQNPFAGMAGGHQQQQGNLNAGAKFSLSTADDDDAAALPSITLYRGTASAGGVNLFV